MKKNVKYLGMAAAALLAVAPVVSSGVANAAISTDNSVPTTPSNPGTPALKNVINFASSMNSVSANTAVSSLTNASAIRSALNVNGSNASVVGVGQAAVVDSTNPSVGVTSLTAGHSYQLIATVAIGGLKANTEYNLKQGNTIVKTPSNRNGVIENVKVTLDFTAYDEALQGQPYFKDMTANGLNLSNGAYAYQAQPFTANETVTAIQQAAEKAVVPMVNVNGVNKQLNYSYPTSVATQLANQGVTVKDGKISSNASSFYITVTTVNPQNNKTATARVQFNKSQEQNNALYPAIYQGSNLIKQGNHTNGTVANTTVNQYSAAAKNLAKNPISELKLVAYTINNQASGHIDLKVLSNNINPNVAGIYPVTLRATNPNGYTTTLTVNVAVNPAAAGSTQRTATIKYVPGYGVNVWNILSDTARSFTGVRAMDGQTVTVLGTKTANGIKYYQVKVGSTTGYVEAKFIDGASTETTKPSTDSNKEEKMSGVAVVKYNGRGGVNLLNGAGKYQNHYVYNGHAYKIFAKKVVRGELAYRLGSDSQWIPAKFVTLR